MTGSDLCADIGALSISHWGEQLCGDSVEVIQPEDGDSTVIVLADGLGSGVKASILSTLTSKIISTMLAAGMRLEDAVSTIISTLPVCSVRGIAYSTFTIIRITGGRRAEFIIYDNPRVIMLRGGDEYRLPFSAQEIHGKRIIRSETELCEGDIIFAFTDGVEHAGVGRSYNFGWKREDIIEFMKPFKGVGFAAKTLTKILLDETERLYGGKPGDDATVCTVLIRRREPVNLLIGPPSNRDDCGKMMSLFFSKKGKHIVCGGTTSTIAAEYLGKPIRTNLLYFDPEIPPTAEIEGVDLVTEGVITVSRVLEYAKNYLGDNSLYSKWSVGQDGASKIARILFEEATDINFFVGRAVNPAHQNPTLPIGFSIKMKLVEELTECLTKMGKKIKVNYF
ncbi:MAG TPA: SpoIIE family protein phosphatase [Bacillota bacterium]|nr:SpoIIE family protein phosphatase [Clostridiales bacterium]HPT85316.1 SpoIIE family protein phosphatase [Bacillota bacterium]